MRGVVLVEGDWARLSRPDNLRFNDNEDLFIMEDNGSDLTRFPQTRGVNQVWVLPRHEERQEGAQNLVLLASTADEPTGPWFSFDNRILYLSLQGEPSRVLAIRHPTTFNRPYDR